MRGRYSPGMSTQSIIAACIGKFATLDSANFPGSARPTLYFDDVPANDASSNPIQAVGTSGICVLKDDGQDVKLMGFGPAGVPTPTREVANFRIEVYYELLTDVDAAALAIKRNGGTAAQRQGFDFGTLADLASPRGTFVIRRLKEQRKQAGWNQTVQNVHCCTLTYVVEVLESA